MTKSELRTELRKRVGDDIRITGTASSGTVYTLVSSELVQPDGTWKDLQLIITGTTDDEAPKDEARRIVASTFSDYTVRVEIPFSAAPESGDTWQIAIFKNSEYDRVVRKALKIFSRYKPLGFSEDLAVSAGAKRFTPTSSNDIVLAEKVEYYNASTEEHHVYSGWRWDEDGQYIEFENWWTETKTLSLHGKKMHTFPSDDDDSHTVLDRDLDNFIDLCAAHFLLELSERDFYDKFGSLNPSVLKKKDIVRDYSGMREAVQNYLKIVAERITGDYRTQLSVQVPAKTAGSGAMRINKGADPDGMALPSVFWTND